MNLDQTQPLSSQTRSARHVYRCPCGTDVEVDPAAGGKCQKCDRVVPGTVTRMSLTMTFSGSGPEPPGSTPVVDDGPDKLIGARLGHFEIIDSIGQGGMGRVYRALDTSLQRYVAVKVIRTDGKLDPRSRERLLHEAVAQARVNHPNIVTIYYVGRHDDTSFLAMELIDGYDANELIRQGEIPYETLCSIAIKITHALDVASQTGIVHSDIKPQNLLMLPDGNVKLSDFGMATIQGASEGRLVGGTPNYLAPELLAGEQPDIQSDMYALGVTLFELTFGRLPVALTGSSLKEWSAVHETARIRFPEPWPDHLPERWKKVLVRLLQKNPDDRYSSYQELGQELQSILPVKRRQALLVARSIAWLIDISTIAIATIIPAALSALFLPRISNNLENLVFLPIMLIYIAVAYGWRQSVGRELVHVKVVNQYSLLPARKVMAIRECLRMQLLWWIILASITELIFPFSPILLVGMGIILTAIDFLYTATLGRGQSLHDKLMRTQAVVGSDTN